MKPHRDWALWLGANVLALVVMERRALTEDKRNKLQQMKVPCPTLSTTLRCWLGINPRRHHRWLFIPALIGFVAWFLYHIILDYEIDEIIQAIEEKIDEQSNRSAAC